MPFKVTVSKNRGVRFSIDQQTFALHVEDDDEQPRMQRLHWYARQLRIALRRLSRGMPDA